MVDHTTRHLLHPQKRTYITTHPVLLSAHLNTGYSHSKYPEVGLVSVMSTAPACAALEPVTTVPVPLRAVGYQCTCPDVSCTPIHTPGAICCCLPDHAYSASRGSTSASAFRALDGVSTLLCSVHELWVSAAARPAARTESGLVSRRAGRLAGSCESFLLQFVVCLMRSNVSNIAAEYSSEDANRSTKRHAGLLAFRCAQ